MASLSDTAVDALRTNFTGELLVSGDAGYDEARSLWNGDIDRRPALIARAQNAEAVAAAIAFARANELEIAIRGGAGGPLHDDQQGHGPLPGRGC